MTMLRGFAFKYRRLLSDLSPILTALILAIVYFLTVVPNSRPSWGKYVFAALAILMVDRILMTWYYRRKLLPPIVAFKRGRREGKAFSQAELADFYRQFAGHVTKSQIVSFWAWVAAALILATSSFIWIQRSWVVFIGIVFTGLIAGSVSLAMSYFFVKWLMRPLIEEVIGGLDQLPDVSSQRIPIRYKIGGSIMAFAAIAFLAFGVLMYSRLSMALDAFAIQSGEAQAKALAGQLGEAPADQRASLLTNQKNALWTLVPLEADGRARQDQASGPFNDKALAGLFPIRQAVEVGREFRTDHGAVRLYPIKGGGFLALVANPDFMASLMGHMSLFGFLFLVATLVVFALYILGLSRDMGMSLQRMVEFNDRLAAGDLTRVPAIWSDDEMGNVADNMRKTFQSLNRMSRELASASSAVDGEVSKTAGVTESLHKQVASQTYFADQTTKSVKSMEQGMQRVSKAMEQVANATQEVSSTILQMQASVEEIARNSDVLIESVEKTVSSSNEIAASSSEVKGATDKLHQSSQEAVSFLAELDASLEETRRNAKSLSEGSTRMTQDAETGFNSVAAVEEEILRTSNATEDSRNTLRELVASIEKIGRIVGVIQDVTEQTNLLSLNASIIAAGAGEYGKSFAVVATQIRELSARTAGNAKEIRTLIHSLTQGGAEMASSMDKTFTVVTRSADLSREAGAALRTILESASSQEEMNKRIASATEELAHGGQSANRAMHRIFEMIEGISRATKDQVASTQYLNDEAERVRDVALQLKNATEEQAKGTRVISEAVTHIMEDSHQANQAVNAQTKESSAIYDAMKQVTATAQSVEEAFGELTQAAAHLQRSAALLRQEIRVFKTT
jgi:methyl-accepting chemotaxis protein